MTRFAISRRTLLAATAATLASPALGQGTWPTRPLRIVVPFGGGGGTDVTTRILAPRLQEILGQPVVVENRAGAGGVVGTDYVAKLPPNGDVLVLTTLSPIGLAPGLSAAMPFDPIRDLTPIAPTVFVPICLGVTTRGIDARTGEDFAALLRANPGRFQFGSSGVGSSGHIAAATFAIKAGAQVEHVPYRGGGQVFAALQSGEIHYCCDIPSLLKPFHDAGTARILFTATDERSSLIPNVPTAREAGLPDYKAYSWYGFFGPAGLPRELTGRIASEVGKVMQAKEIQDKLIGFGAVPLWNTPAQFETYFRGEVVRYARLIKAANVVID